MSHKNTHRYADGWANAVAYVGDEHPNVELYEMHLMGCMVCQEFVDLARMLVLGAEPAQKPSLIAWYVLAKLWCEESESARSREPLMWINA